MSFLLLRVRSSVHVRANRVWCACARARVPCERARVQQACSRTCKSEGAGQRSQGSSVEGGGSASFWRCRVSFHMNARPLLSGMRDA